MDKCKAEIELFLQALINWIIFKAGSRYNAAAKQ